MAIQYIVVEAKKPHFIALHALSYVIHFPSTLQKLGIPFPNVRAPVKSYNSQHVNS
jgi:hypothetical protein